jgi:hypothetical protein
VWCYGAVLYARRKGVRRVQYAISEESKSLTTWTPLFRGNGGSFSIEGVEYTVDTHGTASQALLTADDGDVVAVAHGLGRTPWTVHSGGWSYTFVRSIERWSEQLLVAGGEQIGVVRKVATKRKRWAEAELPDMDAPVAVFVVAVVLTMWSGSDVTAGSALN